MNTGIVKSKASGIALMGKVLVGVMVVAGGMMPTGARAAAADMQFQLLLTNICGGGVTPGPGWDLVKLGELCTAVGVAAGGGANLSMNTGTSNAGSASRTKKKTLKDLMEEKSEAAIGSSSDENGWGFLITPQFGKSTRTETELENGYHSELKGMVVGLDYRFSDSLVFGATISHNKDTATFINNAGSLKTTSNSLIIYGTWLPAEAVAVDAYWGKGKLNLETGRYVSYAPIVGITSGSTTGNQQMAGMSVSYQGNVRSIDISPFINFDYIKTSIKGYNETGGSNTCVDSFGATFSCGSELLALHYGDRSVISSTSSVGIRLGSSYGYGWGTFLPSVRSAAVHEFQNKSKQINNQLVFTPGTVLAVDTDSPDRNYLNVGVGLVAALNSGAQLFLDYEKRTQDRLLSGWAVSLGGLFEF